PLSITFSENSPRRFLNHSERNIRIARRLAALFIFRHRLNNVSVELSYFNIDWPILRFHRNNPAFERAPLDLVSANTKRGSLRKKQFAKHRPLFGATEDGQQDSRAVLLHLHRREIAVQGAEFKGALHYMTKYLRRNIVHVRLNHPETFISRRGSIRSTDLILTNQDAQSVWKLFILSRARAVTGLL